MWRKTTDTPWEAPADYSRPAVLWIRILIAGTVLSTCTLVQFGCTRSDQYRHTSTIPTYRDHGASNGKNEVSPPETIAAYRDPGTEDRHGGDGGYAARLVVNGNRTVRVYWTAGWRLYKSYGVPSGLQDQRMERPGNWLPAREIERPEDGALLLLDAHPVPGDGNALLWSEIRYGDDGFRRPLPHFLYSGYQEDAEVQDVASVLDDEASAHMKPLHWQPPVILPSSRKMVNVLWLDSRESHVSYGVHGFTDNYPKPYVRSHDLETGLLSPVKRFARPGRFGIRRIAGAVAEDGTQHVAWPSGDTVFYRRIKGKEWSSIKQVIPVGPVSPSIGSVNSIDVAIASDGNPIIGVITSAGPGHEHGNALIVASSATGSRWRAKRWPLPGARDLKIALDGGSGVIHVTFQTDAKLTEPSRSMDLYERIGIRDYDSRLQHATIFDGYLSDPLVIAEESKRAQFDVALAKGVLHIIWVEHEGRDILLKYGSIHADDVQ